MRSESARRLRIRWAAIGAAIAVTLGGGGLGIVQATTSSGPRAIYSAINPCRLADLRPAPVTVGPRTAPLGPSETYTLEGWGEVGNCTLPTGTAGLALNVTAVDPTASTFLRLWPADEPQPETSNLNPVPGSPPTPNAVNVKLSSTGEFSIFNRFGNVSVIIDVVGVYDDHNHDDRYYSKSQVNDLLAPMQAKLDTLENPVAVLGTSLDIADLTTSATVHATVSVTPAYDGKVLATSTAYVYQTTTTQLVARCYLTTRTTSEFGAQQFANIDQVTNASEVIAGTRLFDAQAGVPITINLVCTANTTNTGKIGEIWLTAVLLPG